MNDDYASGTDRQLIAAYMIANRLEPIRMANIGYEYEEYRHCYLFITCEATRDMKTVFAVRTIFVNDGGRIDSEVVCRSETRRDAERDFEREEVRQRDRVRELNSRHHQYRASGVSRGYEDVLEEVVRAFQVDNFWPTVIEGRPAVTFSIYCCNPEQAMDKFAALFDYDRRKVVVFLDDPYGVKRREVPGNKVGKSQSKPKKAATAKRTSSRSGSRRSTSGPMKGRGRILSNHRVVSGIWRGCE